MTAGFTLPFMQIVTIKLNSNLGCLYLKLVQCYFIALNRNTRYGGYLGNLLIWRTKQKRRKKSIYTKCMLSSTSNSKSNNYSLSTRLRETMETLYFWANFLLKFNLYQISQYLSHNFKHHIFSRSFGEMCTHANCKTDNTGERLQTT